MNIKDVLPVVSLAAEFALEKDDAYKYLYFADGKVCATSGTMGAVLNAGENFPPLGQGSPVGTPAAPLTKILRALQGMGDEVDVRSTDQRLIVQAGKHRTQLPLLRVEFIGDIDRSMPVKAGSLGEAFWESLAAVLPTVAPASGNPAHQGVWWAPDGALVSTDALRITSVESGVSCPGGVGLLVPLPFLRAAGIGWAGAAVDDRGCLWLLGAAGGVWSAVMAVEFPSATSNQILSTCRARAESGGTSVTGVPTGVGDAVDRLLLSSEFSPWRVVVEVGTDEVRLAVPETDGGAASEESFPAVVEGPGCTFAVNGRFLRHALTSFLTMHVHDARSPIYFHNGKGGTAEHLIVPLFS